MIFYLHYILLTSGLSGTSVLLAVYFKTYSDASQGETGALLMAIPFVSLFIKPIFCSMADRRQAHHTCLMLSLLVMMVGFSPFLVVPFFPAFYEGYPRYSWYLLVVACLIGSSGLNVAWSLGDCLAVNHAQRTGVPFGRMRLMGTLSWGVYGFIIGQINEHPSLPKYMPAFIILHLSVAIELLLLAFWDRSSFEMVDPLMKESSNAELAAETDEQLQQVDQTDQRFGTLGKLKGKQIDNLADSVPSSLGGTLKINPQAAKALFEVLASNDEELMKRLTSIEQQQNAETNDAPASKQFEALAVANKAHHQQQLGSLERIVEGEHLESGLGRTAAVGAPKKNPQLILLKMILVEDGRVLKYIMLFTAFGAFVAPINFFFVSMESLCHERGYNFSQLAGAVLMSQALIETVAFLVVPSLLNSFTRWSLLSVGLAIMSTKYIFYAGWYYDASVSPYWAVLSEWSHGIPYGIFCTIMADVSLMFANQSRLFIPELRRLGFLRADTSHSSKEAIEAEERSIKMALRATMQALFSGFMDGLGSGAGALLCGFISDYYSYHNVWLLFSTLTVMVFTFHLLVEVTGSRWSDAYKPTKGTKAYEIMELSRATAEAQKRRLAEAKAAKSAAATAAAGRKSIQVAADGNNNGAPPV
jgi:hypothetical protein